MKNKQNDFQCVDKAEKLRRKVLSGKYGNEVRFVNDFELRIRGVGWFESSLITLK
jgi:hypothetical protein